MKYRSTDRCNSAKSSRLAIAFSNLVASFKGPQAVVEVTDVGVSVGSCCRNGRIKGGLVKIARLVKLMTTIRNIFEDKR